MKYLTLLALIPLSGCTLIAGDLVDKGVKYGDKYCEEPQAQREVYRNLINAEAQANPGGLESIVVTCAGDE